MISSRQMTDLFSLRSTFPVIQEVNPFYPEETREMLKVSDFGIVSDYKSDFEVFLTIIC